MTSEASGLASARMRFSRRILSVVLWCLCAGAALWFRTSLVAEFQAAAGDGIQYHKLAQQLRLEHRFAYEPPPAPLAYTRLPGYPLFLAALSPTTPLNMPEHLRLATRANAVLDVLTALCVAFMAWRLGFSLFVQLCGFFAVVFFPLLFFLASHGLCESLATFLHTAAVATALCATQVSTDRRKIALALLCGGLLGMAMLTRIDSILAAPALCMLLWLSSEKVIRKLTLCAVCLSLAACTYAPWPLRNLRASGEVHLAVPAWIDMDGRPVPMGMMRWAATWATGRIPGQSYPLFVVAFGRPLDPNRKGVLTPAMYDDEAERQEIAELFSRYNVEKLSPAVDAAFYRLARLRLSRHPFRTLVVLPLKRIATLWSPMPLYEMSMRSKLLRLPETRAAWDNAGTGLLFLSLFGAFWSVFDKKRRFLALSLLLLPFFRTFAFPFLHPIPLQRYLAEAIPTLLLFLGCAVSGPLGFLRAGWNQESELFRVRNRST